MSELRTEFFESFDGSKLAVHRMGEGRPVLLLHGLFSSADMNWIRFGHAKTLAQAGFAVIMPDLRAHGQSAAPHDPAAYPSDVLYRDAAALVEGLGLTDYDLAGFSLGARTSARCVISGFAPRRLALCGMGLEGLAGWERRASFFIDAIDRYDDVKSADPAHFAVSFMRRMKVDRVATRHLLLAVDDIEHAELARITMPTAVICGDKDRDNGSPEDLAKTLPNGRHITIPGSHMSCVTEPDLGEAIRDFLTAE